MMVRPGHVWGGLFAAGSVYETYALATSKEGHTLSEVTRALFRANTPAGRTLFVSAWVGLSAWLVPHIAFKAAETVVDAVESAIEFVNATDE